MASNINISEGDTNLITVTAEAPKTVNIVSGQSTIVSVTTQGPQGPPGLTADLSAYTLTSSFNSFTGSYRLDSASFDLRIKNVTFDTSSLTTTSSFNSFTASYNTGSFTGSFNGNLLGTASWSNNTLTASYVNPLNQNVIITGSIFVTQSHISTVDYIDFTSLTIAGAPAHNQGRIHWSDDTKTLEIDTDKEGFMIEVGHQSVVRVYNDTGNNIGAGTIVYISGSQGNQPKIVTASYEGDPTSAATLGFAATLIQGSGGNKHGYVVTSGILKNVNTSQYSVGTQLYLSSSGQFTNVPPDAPRHEVRLGKVLVSNNTTGVIYVDIMNGYELDELHDLKTTTATNGDLLVYSSSLWTNSKQLTGSYALTGSLSFTGGGITGSLLGTASYADNALQADSAASATNASAVGVINPQSADPQIPAIEYSLPILTTQRTSGYDSNGYTGVYESSKLLYNHSLDILSYTGSSARILIGYPDAPTAIPPANLGMLQVSGSVYATSYTGSLQGTSSWANKALTASYLDNYIPPFPFTGSAAITGSLTVTGSTIISSSNATQLQVGSNLLFISSSGNVGIGNILPTASLHITGRGTTSATIALRVENSSASELLTLLNDGDFKVGNSVLRNTRINSYAVSITSIGIGTWDGRTSVSAIYSQAIGDSAVITQERSTVIGHKSYSAVQGGIAIGYEAKAEEAASFTVGSATSNVTNIYFGSGRSRQYGIFGAVSTGNGVSYTINGSGGNGTNTLGGNLILAGGKGTGTGLAGSIIFQTATPTGSGTILQSLAERMRIDANGNVGIGRIPTSSLDVAGTTRLSGSFNTAISGSTLTVIGSGSAQPIFTVQGSQGELFSVTDSLSGSLFSVNNISGLPILETFSDDTVLMGSYLAPVLTTTVRNTLTNSGSFTVYSVPTSSYDGVFVEYVAKSGSNARAGNIMATWIGTTVTYAETTTTDIGSTTGLSFIAVISGSNLAVTGSATTPSWVIKSVIKAI